MLENGPDCLYERLVENDSIAAEKIHPNNHRRIIRALEIIEITGRTKADHEEDAGKRALYSHLIVGLDVDREILYERIGRRLDIMMNQGFLEEAEGLWKNGIRNVQSVQAIGYRELHQSIEGTLTLDESVELIKKNTRNYAKRQMTYFRNKLDIVWFDADLGTDELTLRILKKLKDFVY